MTLGFIDLGAKGLAVLIPREVVETLEWKEGDEIIGDIPMTGAELILYRRNVAAKPHLTGPNNIVKSGD